MNLRRVLHIVGLLTLVVVVVPFVVYAFPSAVGADHSFVVLSGSMEPDIAPGDVVIVDEGSTEAIEEGDIITFVRGENGKPVTHRVVGVEERGDTTAFTTKGDANEDVDAQPVPAGNVIGEVTVTIPYIGHVIQFTQRPVGFVVLVLLPLGLLGFSEIWTIVNNQRERDDGDGVGGETVATDATAPTADGDDDGEITLTGTDLTLTGGILALVAPYTVYVALQLRNPVTFTAAFAAAFSFVGVAGLWLTARRADTGGSAAGPGSPDDTADGQDDAAPFDEGDADWALADADGSFTFDETDGDTFTDESDGAFGGGVEAAADPADPAPEGNEPTADATVEPDREDDTPDENGFFDGPASETEPADSGVFDETVGSTEEVD